MPLEVIGAGFGRTGTLTLKLALERLGIAPCHHMTEIIADPRQGLGWNRAADGEAVDWDRVYAGYRATVDWPGCHFYAELAQRYPEAKVILSLRDPERWYESMSQTILKTMDMLLNAPMAGADADHPMRFAGLLIGRDTFDHDFSKDNVIATYERHNAEVRERIAADRLLEFEPSHGWEPLCRFLGVAVPEEDFPHTNAREEFWQHAAKGNFADGSR
ncbi:MAG TPA: sulfotransferase [Novosphingobium sp.]|nr:sulfotransferase [Novosphingobium sp.]